MSLPTREEINVYDSLDERTACEHFLGKNLAEAEALFRKNSFPYLEDLMFMGASAFRFYIQAAIRYLESDAAQNDYETVDYFAALLEYRIDCEAEDLRPIADPLASVCGSLIQQSDKFDLRPEEGIVSRLEALRRTMSGMENSGNRRPS